MAENKQSSHTSFLADHMLIKLGKYLRLLGYDTTWNTGLRTHELILLANREGRIFLTRNRRLAQEYPKPDRALQLSDDDPVKQLRVVVEQLELDSRSRLFSRCVFCNVPVERVADNSSIRDRVPAGIYERITEFHVCPACHRIYWLGSHHPRTLRKLGLLHADA